MLGSEVCGSAASAVSTSSAHAIAAPHVQMTNCFAFCHDCLIHHYYLARSLNLNCLRNLQLPKFDTLAFEFDAITCPAISEVILTIYEYLEAR